MRTTFGKSLYLCIVFDLHTCTTMVYMMLNLVRLLLWHPAESGVVHASRLGVHCFKEL